MEPTDARLTGQRLARLDAALAAVRGARERGERALEASPDARPALERNLQIALQACLDAGAGLLADDAIPDSYAEVFERLAASGAISTALARRLVPVADLRNQLVFGYLDGALDDLFERLAVLDAVGEFADIVRRCVDDTVA